MVGRGGQGEVLRALDTLHDRQVAVKVRRLASEDERDAVLGEGRILLTCPPHAGLVVAREDFFWEDGYCLVMDWVEGSSLARALAERGAPGLPLEEVIGVLGEVAAALDHLHARGIVHKDVKPSNILVTPSGSAVLVDFGIATAGDARAAGGPDSSGTPGYRAPEIAAGGRAVPAADVFGLAATAYALLFGGAPRPGSGGLPPGIPPERARAVRAALARGLALDPSRRPASAGALVAAMRAGAGAPNNLPAALTSFVGRAREAADVARLLEEERLVTLVGTGGIGKTRLALRVASDVLERHTDGAWMADLAPLRDPSLVPAAVLAAVGAPPDPRRDPADALVEHLATRDLVLVLDNCEHLAAEAAALAGRLLAECRRVRVVATSREPLRVPGERVFRVPPLDLPAAGTDLGESAAARLFVERASASGGSFALTTANAAAVAEICRRVEGIPLALELAAARTRALSAEQIAERLGDRMRLLSGGARTAEPRQQTLRAAIDWSHDLLSEDERVLYRRASVFAGGFSLEAAEGVCSGDGLGAVAEVLVQLVDRSLVQADGGRFRMLEPLRVDAAGRLEDSGEGPAVHSRHLAWFLAFAERAGGETSGGEQAERLEALEREHDNLRTALGVAAAAPGDSALRLATALGGFWMVRGHLTEGRARVEEALGSPAAAGAPLLRARALAEAGRLALGAADYPGAQAHLGESLALSRSAADVPGICTALQRLGDVARMRRDYGAARPLFSEALEIARSLGRDAVAAAALWGLGSCAHMEGDCRTARERYTESLELRRALGDAGGVAGSLGALGLVADTMGDLDEARRLYTESLTMRRELGDARGEGWVLLSLGLLALRREQYGDAGPLFSQAETIAGGIGDRHVRAQALRGLARLARRDGDAAGARALYERSLALGREIGEGEFVAAAQCGLGALALDAGDVPEARALYREALAERARLGLDEGIAQCLDGLARAAAADEDFARAALLLGAAEARRAAIGAVVAPVDRDEVERTGVAAAGFEDARARGRSLSLPEVLARVEIG